MRELAQAFLDYSRVAESIKRCQANIEANSVETTSVKSQRISNIIFRLNTLQQELPEYIERVKVAREACPEGTAVFTFGDEVYSVHDKKIAIIKSTPLEDKEI